MATFEDVEDAGRAVSEIMHSGILPSVLELIDQHGIKAINLFTNLNLPEVEIILLAEADGYTKEETEYQITRDHRCLQEEQGLNRRTGQDTARGAGAVGGAQSGRRGFQATKQEPVW